MLSWYFAIYFHPTLQKQGDLSVHVINTGFYSFFLFFSFFLKAAAPPASIRRGQCCTSRKLNEAPEECGPFRAPEFQLSSRCQGGFYLCQSVCVTTSASIPVAQPPLASAFSHSLINCKTATTIDVTTVMVSAHGEGCRSAQPVPVKQVPHGTNPFSFSEFRVLMA